MREIIVDRENGAKAFVLFELTKGNIAEIKDRYILGQGNQVSSYQDRSYRFKTKEVYERGLPGTHESRN